MRQPLFGILYALVMIALIVGIDLAFLRDSTVLRLVVNVGIVAVFGIVYLRFFNRTS